MTFTFSLPEEFGDAVRNLGDVGGVKGWLINLKDFLIGLMNIFESKFVVCSIKITNVNNVCTSTKNIQTFENL